MLFSRPSTYLVVTCTPSSRTTSKDSVKTDAFMGRKATDIHGDREQDKKRKKIQRVVKPLTPEL